MEAHGERAAFHHTHVQTMSKCNNARQHQTDVLKYSLRKLCVGCRKPKARTKDALKEYNVILVTDLQPSACAI